MKTVMIAFWMLVTAPVTLGQPVHQIDGSIEATRPRLFNTIRPDDQKIFPGITMLGTSDIWDPHNLEYTFDPVHLERRLDLLVDINEPDRWILADIERLTYSNGKRINRETPEDFLIAITNIKLLRPENPAAIDGGVSVSWTRLLNLDEETGRYAHHGEWIADAQRWRPAIEVADYWGSPQYRDGRSQEEWLLRLEVFNMLFRQEFPDKPLAIVIWHRERINGLEQWITQDDYVEMGLAARALGNHVIAFGREDDPGGENFERAQAYFEALAREWARFR